MGLSSVLIFLVRGLLNRTCLFLLRDSENTILVEGQAGNLRLAKFRIRTNLIKYGLKLDSEI